MKSVTFTEQDENIMVQALDALSCIQGNGLAVAEVCKEIIAKLHSAPELTTPSDEEKT